MNRLSKWLFALLNKRVKKSTPVVGVKTIKDVLLSDSEKKLTSIKMKPRFKYITVVEMSPEVYQLFQFLDDLGYKRVYERCDYPGDFLVTYPELDGYPCYVTTDNPPEGDSVIYCEDNLSFWTDVVAMCEDSDKMQVFVLDQGCVFDNGSFLLKGDTVVCKLDKLPNHFIAHKASIEELEKIYFD